MEPPTYYEEEHSDDEQCNRRAQHISIESLVVDFQMENQGENARDENQEPRERPIGAYFEPTIGHYESPILLPTGKDNEHEIKGSLIRMLGRDTFDGVGNPHTHLARFTEICRAFKSPGVPETYVFMKTFSFSLGGKAKDWLNNHEPRTFRTWEQLAKAFLMQYFPLRKIKEIRNKISSFTQGDDENFYEAYERFKGLQRECPYHGIRKEDLFQSFYDGMDEDARNRIDIVSGGSIMEKTPSEGLEIIEKIAKNSHQWGGDRNHLKKKDKKSSSKVVTKDEFNNLVKIVNNLAASLGNIGKHLNDDEYSYPSKDQDEYEEHKESCHYEESFATPTFDMDFNHFEKPQGTHSMLLEMLEEQKRMNAQLRKLDEKMDANFEEMVENREKFRMNLSSMSNEGEEECKEDDIEMHVETYEHDATFEDNEPSFIPLEDMPLTQEMRTALEHLPDDDDMRHLFRILAQVYIDNDSALLVNEE